MRARIHVSPWGVHPVRPHAGADAQTVLERWWAEVGRILLHHDAPPRGGEARVSGGVADAADAHGDRR
jgi:hypothetical protein